MTPLHLAVANNYMDIVEVLLSHDAAIDCQDAKGRTPLHIAVAFGYTDMIDLILNAVILNLYANSVSMEP